MLAKMAGCALNHVRFRSSWCAYPLTACPFPHVQGEYAAAVQESSVAVELNPTYVKALMRRCQAQEHMDKLEEALAGEEGSMLVCGNMCGR